MMNVSKDSDFSDQKATVPDYRGRERERAEWEGRVGGGGGGRGVNNVQCPVILWVIVIDFFRLQKASSARLSCLTVKKKK